jgi:hypothetical protein
LAIPPIPLPHLFPTIPEFLSFPIDKLKMPRIIYPCSQIYSILFLFFLQFLAMEGSSLDEFSAKGDFRENDGGLRCWTNGNGQEAHWMGEGQTVERGKFWYKCEEGKLKPAGCLDENG